VGPQKELNEAASGKGKEVHMKKDPGNPEPAINSGEKMSMRDEKKKGIQHQEILRSLA